MIDNRGCMHCRRDYNEEAYNCKKCIRNPELRDFFASSCEFYPLELEGNHINLWFEDAESKYTIALFIEHKDGWDIKFIGTRPLDKRVDWNNFHKLITLGYKLRESNG